jgi:hypothetical protein
MAKANEEKAKLIIYQGAVGLNEIAGGCLIQRTSGRVFDTTNKREGA